MNELALFAGVGGGVLGGTLLGWTTVGAVEIDEFCRKVLLKRQSEGLLPEFPIWDDIRTFDGKPWRGLVDVVSGGFPCQPYSSSGKRKGAADERNLWPDTVRVVREVGPRFVFLENVPGLLRFDYFGNILGDLAEGGYDVRWEVVSAKQLGAPHLRERLWILGRNRNPDGVQRRQGVGVQEGEKTEPRRTGSKPGVFRHPEYNGLPVAEKRESPPSGEHRGSARPEEAEQPERPGCEPGVMGSPRGGGNIRGVSRRMRRKVLPTDGGNETSVHDAHRGRHGPSKEEVLPGRKCDEFPGWWDSESGLVRVVDGVPDRVDRIRTLGNSQVPVVAAAAFLILSHGWI